MALAFHHPDHSLQLQQHVASQTPILHGDLLQSGSFANMLNRSFDTLTFVRHQANCMPLHGYSKSRAVRALEAEFAL